MRLAIPGAEIENALKVNFNEIDKRRTSDFCNQISMDQVGTPTCIFACVQAETKEWVFAATAPKTPQKVNRFAHADAVWESVRDQWFGQRFIHMLKDAEYNLKAAENYIVYTNGYAPTPGPPRLVGAGLGGKTTGHLPSVPIDKLAEFRWKAYDDTIGSNRHVSRAHEQGLTFNRQMFPMGLKELQLRTQCYVSALCEESAAFVMCPHTRAFGRSTSGEGGAGGIVARLSRS